MTAPAAPDRSGPLIDLIGVPTPEQLRAYIRISGLVGTVQARLDREAQARRDDNAAA